MNDQKMEIHDICDKLQKLADSGVFSPHTVEACAQGASLLKKIREVVMSSPDEGSIVEDLRSILAEQGEG